jgi:The  BURPS668_1122 family of deaminases
MATMAFAPLSDQALAKLFVQGSNSKIQGFAAFREIVTNLQMWVEGNYGAMGTEKFFSTSRTPDKGERLADEGNIAWSWAQIGGVTKDWWAYSTNSKMPKSREAKQQLSDMIASLSGTKKKEPNFGWLSGGTIAENHTEPKLLAEIQDEFDLDPNSSAGYIIIVSSRDVCSSCQRLIHSFAQLFPHIIIYGVGLGQVGRGQTDAPEGQRIDTRMRSGSISQDLPAIRSQSAAVKPLQLLCFNGAGIYGGVFTPKG